MTDDPTPILGNKVTFSSDISAFGPQVTALADGSFILAWQNQTDIFARHLDEHGGFIGGDFLSTLSADDAHPLSSPRVFQQSNGRVVVIYNQLVSPSEMPIRWHMVNTDFSPDGNTKPIQLSNTQAALVSSTSTAGGGAFVFETPGSGVDTLTVLCFIDLQGQESVNLQVDASFGFTQQNAAVAGLNNGNVAVAYCIVSNAVGSFVISATIYQPDGFRVAGFLRLSADDVSADFPDIAVLRNGSFVVAWQQADGIAFRHLSQEGVTDFTHPAIVVPGSAGGFKPKVTALNDNAAGFIIAWTAASGVESDGSPNEDIFLQRYGFENNVLQTFGAQVHLTEPGDQGLFNLSIATLRGGISLLDEHVVLAYGSETGDATNITTLNYRFVSVPPIVVLVDPHPCQTEADKVTAAQQKVNNLENKITTLQEELEHGHRSKNQIIKDIANAEKQLLAATEALEEDQKALDVCLSPQR